MSNHAYIKCTTCGKLKPSGYHTEKGFVCTRCEHRNASWYRNIKPISNSEARAIREDARIEFNLTSEEEYIDNRII